MCVRACDCEECVRSAKITQGRGRVAWRYANAKEKKELSLCEADFYSLTHNSGFTRVNLRGQMVLKSSKISQIKKKKKGEQKQEEQSL